MPDSHNTGNGLARIIQDVPTYERETVVEVEEGWFGIVLFDGKGPLILDWDMNQGQLDEYLPHGPARDALTAAMDAWTDRLRQPLENSSEGAHRG